MYQYTTHYPDGYHTDCSKRWPLIICLHGSGERDIPFAELATHQYFQPMFTLTSTRYPAVVAVPQCPQEEWWVPERVEELCVHLLDSRCVDAARIYLCGFSMGGYGTWSTAAHYPQRYAAIAPICGGGEVSDAAVLREIPAWVFHGAMDDVVSVQKSLEMVEALTTAGGNPRLTVYNDGGHNVWEETFANPELYEWFLQNRLDAGA